MNQTTDFAPGTYRFTRSIWQGFNFYKRGSFFVCYACGHVEKYRAGYGDIQATHLAMHSSLFKHHNTCTGTARMSTP